jgi:hypothetical protein
MLFGEGVDTQQKIIDTAVLKLSTRKNPLSLCGSLADIQGPGGF